MDLFSISGLAASVFGLVIIFILSLRYLSLLRWVGGQAYVLSKKQERFTILEVLELLKNAKPFPVSYQKGWKIHSYTHGHRVWFHFLTFTQAGNHSLGSSQGSNSTGSSSAPCIKVFAAFDRVRASAQALLQLVKDTSLSCEWKPGVIAARSVHEVPASEANGRNKTMGSLPVLDDFVRVERVKSMKYHWPWRNYESADNVIPTVIEDFKRYWHREDNGCSWLLQMNEEAQSFVFFLIQPVEDPDQSLLTVITWSAPYAEPFIPVAEAPPVLLSSISEYIHLRRSQMTPLLNISLPHRVTQDGSGDRSRPGSASNKCGQDGFMSRFRSFLDQQYGSCSENSLARTITAEAMRKSATILHYRSRAVAGNAGGFNHAHIIQEEEDESDSEKGKAEGADANPSLSRIVEDANDTATTDIPTEPVRSPLRRAVSDGAYLHCLSTDFPKVPQSLSESKEKAVARYKLMVNQAAADVMAEALRASNIDLESSGTEQAAASNGWIYSSFENNIVVLKKIPLPGSNVQSYIGKGFILAPPKTVWDAIRNPRTRFTYDDTLKKVDILELVNEGIKIVYLYQEVQQLLRKECSDLVMLQGERVEGSKFILAYTSVEHLKAPVVDNIIRGKMMSSGWIVEPVWKDKKVYSLVTYIMQLDYGCPRSSTDRLPFEDMTSKQPMSIYYLQQYLKPAVLLARRESDPAIPT